MARSQAQSDFSVIRERDLALPACAGPVALPDAQALRSQAGELATRWVMRATWLLLLALAVLCTVGAHIPSGE
jgi:small neutral amino acid transporter SnatA (MarC family)